MHTTRTRSGYRQLLAVAIVVIVVDHATKFAASLASGDRHGPVVPVHNPSFSLGLVGASFGVEVALMLAGICAAVVFAVAQIRQGRLSGWAAGLVVGGAVANLADRALTGTVHDFLATPWIVFNVADLAVVAGLLAAGRSIVNAVSTRGAAGDREVRASVR